MIEFRKLTTDDYPVLLEWLQRPHVKQYWNDGDDTLEKIAQHYALGNRQVQHYIAIQNGQDIGFYQYCYDLNHNIGIDMFLANANQISKGLGTKCLNAFGDFVTKLEKCHCLSVDPHPDNKRGIRCYEKCGFIHNVAASNDQIYFMQKHLS